MLLYIYSIDSVKRMNLNDIVKIEVKKTQTEFVLIKHIYIFRIQERILAQRYILIN
jgi:hypothetical protein